MNLTLSRALLVSALALSALAGCDDDKPTPAAGTAAGTAAGSTAGTAAGTTAGVDGGATPPPAPPVSGEHYLNIALNEFALVLPFKLTFTAGAGQFDQVTLQAIKNGAVSDPIATLTNVPVPNNQLFELDFGSATLPADFSPTSSNVDIKLKLIVTELREGSFCGDIRGEITTFATPVTTSTFAAYPFGAEGDAPASSCAQTVVEYDPIAECPMITDGDNSAFPSAGLMRSFRVVLPTGYDAAQTYPLLIAFHGLGGSVSGLLEESAISVATQAGGVILIAAESQGDLGAEWESGVFGPTKDLAFFDDLLKCAKERLSVDPAQVHIAGHSAGTFFSAAVSLQRSEVLATTSLVSAGMSVDYRAPAQKRPFFFTWGGAEDMAYEQNFDVQTRGLIDTFSTNGHPVVSCDHSNLPLADGDSRHSWPDVASTWIVDFIKAHPQGVTPLPYAMGTPEAWTGTCAVR